MIRKCSRCRYAVKGIENEAHLYCHRSPPQSVAVGTGISFPFPPVHPGGWCGEFRMALMRLFRGHGKA